ncbi:hypothetical protein V8C44DRAFT_353163 [Trichoderma aethiopicum]
MGYCTRPLTIGQLLVICAILPRGQGSRKSLRRSEATVPSRSIFSVMSHWLYLRGYLRCLAGSTWARSSALDGSHDSETEVHCLKILRARDSAVLIDDCTARLRCMILHCDGKMA